MKYEIFILILGVVISLIYLAKIKNTTSAFIVFIQIISLGLSFFVNPTIGHYLFGIAILLSLFYPVINKVESLLNRRLIWLFLFPILAVFTYGILNFSGYNYVRLALPITFFVFVYSIANKKKFKYEIGFMILFVADALIRFIGFFH